MRLLASSGPPPRLGRHQRVAIDRHVVLGQIRWRSTPSPAAGLIPVRKYGPDNVAAIEPIRPCESRQSVFIAFHMCRVENCRPFRAIGEDVLPGHAARHADLVEDVGDKEVAKSSASATAASHHALQVRETGCRRSDSSRRAYRAMCG